MKFFDDLIGDVHVMIMKTGAVVTVPPHFDDDDVRAWGAVATIKMVEDNSGDVVNEPSTGAPKKTPAEQLLETDAAERKPKKELEKMDTTTMQRAVDKAVRTADFRQIGELAKYEVARGFTIFSQTDRDRMLKSLFGRDNMPFAKAIQLPGNTQLLQWAMLPIDAEPDAVVHKVDGAAFGVRKASPARESAPPVASLEPRIVLSGIDLDPETAAAVDQAMTINSWMSPEEAFKYVEAMRVAANAATQARTNRSVGRVSSPRGSSPGRAV